MWLLIHAEIKVDPLLPSVGGQISCYEAITYISLDFMIVWNPLQEADSINQHIVA